MGLCLLGGNTTCYAFPCGLSTPGKQGVHVRVMKSVGEGAALGVPT